MELTSSAGRDPWGLNGQPRLVVSSPQAQVPAFETINITGFEAANDQLIIHGLGGDDVLQASGLTADVIHLTLDGGEGGDVLIGSPGTDVLLGGAGDDVLIRDGGFDIVDGGIGNNLIL